MVTEVCRRLLDESVEDIEFPGGKSRDSVRARLANRTVIVTRRTNSARAELEVEILRSLHENGAPVPRIIAFDGEWTIQEDLGEQRLSVALSTANEEGGEKLLEAALDGLYRAQQAGEISGLARRVVAVGAQPDWIAKLVDTPTRLGDSLNIPAPALDRQSIADDLRVETPKLIKWDARPGNAIAMENGGVAWIDWEHSGCRNGLDDMAWLLGDEYVPYWPEVETRLMARYTKALGDFPDPRSPEDYLATFGTFHMCMRLALIVSNKKTDPWWNREYCLATDRVGVTQEMAQRTCLKAAEWSKRTNRTRPLTAWLMAVGEELAGWR